MDEHGNEFYVTWCDSYKEAKAKMDELASKLHKQAFWIAFRKPSRNVFKACVIRP